MKRNFRFLMTTAMAAALALAAPAFAHDGHDHGDEQGHGGCCGGGGCGGKGHHH